MDPEARRFMWGVVAKISQQKNKSAVVLTTHSMEEAEALSTKMGIMVKGGIFRCFGSAQHLKSKYGTGYEIEIKIRKIEEPQQSKIKKEYQVTDQRASLKALLKRMMEMEGDWATFLESQICWDGLGEEL